MREQRHSSKKCFFFYRTEYFDIETFVFSLMQYIVTHTAPLAVSFAGINMSFLSQHRPKNRQSRGCHY